MAGLLDFATDPQSAMMTQMALGLLSAGGPSSRPVSLGQAMGQAGQMGMQGYRDAQSNQMNQMKLDELKKRMAAMNHFKGQLPDNLKGLWDIAPDQVLGKMLKGEDEYTLKPGEARYKGDKQVASMPGQQEITGNYIVKHPDGSFNIDPTLYDAYLGSRRAGAGKSTTIVNPALDPFKNEKALRDEYMGLPQVKSASELNSAFKMIETAYTQPSAANDLAMATKYMKILDPTSVVRESEFAMAVNATGLMDKVYNYANAIKTGQRLNPNQRKDFYDSAKAINKAFQAEASNAANKYKAIASQYGLKPENITIGTEFIPTDPNGGSPPTDSTNAASLPPKPSASNLVKGTIYNTARGPAKWNGLQFETVGE